MRSPDRPFRRRRLTSPTGPLPAAFLYAAIVALPFAAGTLAPRAPKPAAPVRLGLPVIEIESPEPVRPASHRTATLSVSPAAVRDLDRVFGLAGYDLDAVRDATRPVPPLLLQRLPADIGVLEPSALRKEMFFRIALPLVLHVNDAILADRRELLRLVDLMNHGHELDQADGAFLAELAERYRLRTFDIDELLRRVDAIPPSLALAQGAEETGWGTSRLALQSNALFGESRWSRDRRAWYVKSFEDLPSSVAAYALNLNTHPAYAAFRAERAAMRAAGRPIDGEILASLLVPYSERGAAYVASLRRIIRVNRLTALDGARLDRMMRAPRPEPEPVEYL